MRGLAAVMAVALVVAGCAGYYERSADLEAEPIVKKLETMTEPERPKEVPKGLITPKPGGPQAAISTVAKAAGEAETITLSRTLVLAFSTSRDFQFQKEALYLSALSFRQTMHQFEWIPSGSVNSSAAIAGQGDAQAVVSAQASATLALAKNLLTGGSFSISGSASESSVLAGGEGESNSSSLGVSFSQPLLAGSGIAAREAFVEAQRGLLYEARSYELFRQDLAIRTISSYYNLLAQKRKLANAKASIDQYQFLYEKSKALFDKGLTTRLDAFRAEQQKLQAENGYNDDREAYNLALDQFKIQLGFPTDKNIDIADQDILPEIISVDLEQAVKTALAYRLDFLTAKQQLEDSERAVLIARNALLPHLNFFANANVASQPGQNLLDYALDTGSASVGLNLQLPLDQTGPRNSYKSAIIGLARARRGFDLTQDNVKLQVRETVRNLRQAEFTLAIQAQNVALSQQYREYAQIRFEKGEIANRDVVDAQTALQNAQDSYVQAQVTYFIAAIQLRRDIGTLRVDEKGNWH